MALKILLWLTRIMAIMAILFMMMFSLDVFEGNDSFISQLLAFFKHNIPAFLLIIALVVAWRFEIAGGLIFILLFITLGIYWESFSGNRGSLTLIVPYLLVGVLFIIHGALLLRIKE